MTAISTRPAELESTVTLQLLDMIGASWMSQAICVACELEIPDRLTSGPQNAQTLATATACDVDAMLRLLRGLASLGLCVEQGSDRFALTQMGQLICRDAPGGVRSWAIWWGRHLWPIWHDLLNSVRTGRSARERATGRTGYAHLENDAQAAALFNRSMVELTQLVTAKFARICADWHPRLVIDIGGGYGMLLQAVLEACTDARGILYDLPHAIGSARSRLSASGVGARCEFTAGNFFESVPAGGDLYLLKSILHNWKDIEAVQILDQCHRAMPTGARLAIIERTLPQRIRAEARDQAVARSDLNMLVGLGGRERSGSEYAALLTAASFGQVNMCPLAREYTLIECVKT
jgi:hypothetical protein